MSTPKAPKPKTPAVSAVSELPVTRAMLLGVRDELRARIDATNARIDEVSARIDATNARIDGTNARIDTLRSELMAEIHRVGTLVEDQETRNRAVYEVVMGHNARFERLERRMDAMEGTLREILDAVKARPSS